MFLNLTSSLWYRWGVVLILSSLFNSQSIWLNSSKCHSSNWKVIIDYSSQLSLYFNDNHSFFSWYYKRHFGVSVSFLRAEEEVSEPLSAYLKCKLVRFYTVNLSRAALCRWSQSCLQTDDTAVLFLPGLVLCFPPVNQTCPLLLLCAMFACESFLFYFLLLFQLTEFF